MMHGRATLGPAIPVLWSEQLRGTMRTFRLVVEGPSGAVRDFMDRAAAVQLTTHKSGIDPTDHVWWVRPPLSFSSLSASLPWDDGAEHRPEATNVRLSSLQESFNGLLRVRYDADLVEAEVGATPFIRYASTF